MNRPSLIAHSARTAALCLAVPGARYNLPAEVSWRLTMLDAEGDERRGRTTTVVTLLHDLEPDTAYRFDAEGFEGLEFRTAICAGLVDACDFAIMPDVALDDADAAHANTQAFSEAIEAVPKGGTLKVPAGIWTAYPLRLKSDMSLYLAKSAVLRAPSTREGWTILAAQDADGNMLGSWEGLPAACFAAPLHAISAKNLVIEGEGTLDGSGDQGDWWTWPKETRDGARRPRGLHLISSKNVKLFGFTIQNAPSWTIHPQTCNHLVAAGLTIKAPADSPNTDGFNPESCRDTVVTGVRFSVGDDCIAVKAGKRGPKGEDDHLAETRGVSVRHCLMERGHGGLVIGSEMSGGVHDVLIEDCEMIGTDRGLRLKTRRGRGGSVTNITMRRVLLDGVQTALSANAHYHCDADGHSEWVQSRHALAVDTGTPQISSITVENVEVRNLSHAAGVFLGLPEAPIRDIEVRGLKIVSLDPDAIATAPIMADHVRPMRHESIVSERAEVRCDDHSLISQSPISLLSQAGGAQT
ncbi:polygalacturonase [Brucella endophytica]|uniref:Polygalacturonase n=1 Tax=Brucella endophytica TaxID=1963359 RepID=A0A916WJM5_9HYPH|nr:glycoside hydrolase family 28 protein [Brucella endophytica]GGB04126.1 polygalacturonase [Brucella endophytica]